MSESPDWLVSNARDDPLKSDIPRLFKKLWGKASAQLTIQLFMVPS